MAQDLIEALLKLYQTLDKMSGWEDYDIPIDHPFQIKTKVAPPAGHTLPDGLEEELMERKTPAVIDLIKRLPYSRCRHLAPATIAISYSDAQSCRYRPHLAWSPGLWEESTMTVSPSELPLTQAEEDTFGFICVVDTETWEARSVPNIPPYKGCSVHLRGGEACHFLRRGRRDNVVKPASELIKDWTQKFLDLEWTVRRDSDVFNEDENDERGEVCKTIDVPHLFHHHRGRRVC